jgi:hypothetical protein
VDTAAVVAGATATEVKINSEISHGIETREPLPRLIPHLSDQKPLSHSAQGTTRRGRREILCAFLCFCIAVLSLPHVN